MLPRTRQNYRSSRASSSSCCRQTWSGSARLLDPRVASPVPPRFGRSHGSARGTRTRSRLRSSPSVVAPRAGARRRAATPRVRRPPRSFPTDRRGPPPTRCSASSPRPVRASWLARRPARPRSAPSGRAGTPPARPVRSPPRRWCSVAGEEMTRYTMDLILKRWIEPHVDTSAWEFSTSARRTAATPRTGSSRRHRGRRQAQGHLQGAHDHAHRGPGEAPGPQEGVGLPRRPMRRGWNEHRHLPGHHPHRRRRPRVQAPGVFERHAVGGSTPPGTTSSARARSR